MSTALQAKKIDEIMLDLSRLLAKPDFDVLQLRRLELAVQRLWDSKAIDAVDYYVSKAFFAIGKQQRQSAMDAANNVLRLAPGDPVARFNALTIMVGLIELDQAVPLIKSLAASHPDDKDLAKDLIIKGADLLQFNLVRELFRAYDALSVNNGPVNSVRRATAERALEAMDRYGLTDEDLAALMKSAAKALRDRGYDVFRSSRRTLSDGCIVYYLHVNASPDVCAELNFDIADALVEQYEDPCGEFVSFACRPLSDLSTMEVLEAEQL